MTTRTGFIVSAVTAGALTALTSARGRAATEYDSALMRAPTFVDVDGIRTAYYEAGSGQAMVLIHGGQWPATNSAHDFAAIFDRLAARYHVYAFDKLGMGFTDLPPTDADYTMDAIVRHANGFVRTLHLNDVIVAGHSRGALPAARVAMDNPGIVTRLVIFDTNALASDDIKLSDRPDAPPPTTPPTRDQIRQQDLASPITVNKAFITDAFVDMQYRIAQLPKTAIAARTFAAARDAWVRLHPDLVAANPLMGNNLGSVSWWLLDAKHQAIDMIRSGKLTVPTVIIWGWNDPFAPYVLGLDTMKTIAAVQPQTQMHFVNHAGHFVFAEQPADVARLIMSAIPPRSR